MSDCPEYLRLHQLYIHALRRWEKANALRGVRDLDSAEEERVESFRPFVITRNTANVVRGRMIKRPKYTEARHATWRMMTTRSRCRECAKIELVTGRLAALKTGPVRTRQAGKSVVLAVPAEIDCLGAVAAKFDTSISLGANGTPPIGQCTQDG